MPRVKSCYPTPCSGVDVDGHDTMRPVGGEDFAGVGSPAFMNDPLFFGHISIVDQTVLGAVTMRHPDTAIIRTAVSNKVGVLGMKLRVPNRVVFAGHLGFESMCIADK